MVTRVQGGARTGSGQNFKTKAELKRAIAAHDAVQLYDTSWPAAAARMWARELTQDLEWIVIGPDPYHDRKWYATVKRNSKGNLTVV
jgi:hypothetical protein